MSDDPFEATVPNEEKWDGKQNLENPPEELKQADYNKSWEAMYLVDRETCRALDSTIKSLPGWQISGGTTYTPYPPIPKHYKYAVWEMNPGYETHPDYIEWQRLEKLAQEKSPLGMPLLRGVGERRHWCAPERDMFMFINAYRVYKNKFCPCDEHRNEALWDIGWDNEAGGFRERV